MVTASRFLIYACSEGLDLLGQAFLIPWGFWYLVHSFYLEGHWGRAVVCYGTLCSVQAFGRYLGRVCSPVIVSSSDMTTRPQQVFGMLLLASSFVVLCLTNRYWLILMAYFSSGFAGATLLGSSPSYLIGGLCLGGDFDHALGSNSISNVGALRIANSVSGVQSASVSIASAIAADVDGAGRSAILIFTFASLISGLLYGEGHAGTSRHSALGPCIGLALVCVLSAALYVSTNRIAYKRMQWSCWLCLCCDPASRGEHSMRLANIGEHCWGVVLKVLSFLPREETGSSDRRGTGGSGHRRGGSEVNGYSSATGASTSSSYTSPIAAISIPATPEPPLDPSLVPPSFLAANSNAASAAKAFAATLAWRRDNAVDSLMSVPQTDFHQILELYPHAIHGRSLDGCYIVYEVLGRSRPKELANLGISPSRLVWHFILRNEYVLRRLAGSSGDSASDLAPFSQQSRLMTVLDVKGISVADITTDVMSFIRQSGELMDAHYPGVVQRLVICNAPQWFYSVWTFLARVLPDSVRKKIIIIHDTAGLDKFVSPSERPVEYGGTGIPLGAAPEHLGFLALADAWSANANLSQVSQVAIAAGVGTTSANAIAGAKAYDGSSSGSRGRSDVDSKDYPADLDREASQDSDDDDDEERASLVPSRDRHSHEGGAHVDTGAGAGSDGSSSAIDISDSDAPAVAGAGGAFGLVGWVRSRFTKAPTAAHLGERNRFHFDEATGKWALETSADAGDNFNADGNGNAGFSVAYGADDDGEDAEDDDEDEDGYSNTSANANANASFYTTPKRLSSGQQTGSSGGGGNARGKMTPAQLEEHGLVLAIQAAHLAATMGRNAVGAGAGAGAGPAGRGVGLGAGGGIGAYSSDSFGSGGGGMKDSSGHSRDEEAGYGSGLGGLRAPSQDLDITFLPFSTNPSAGAQTSPSSNVRALVFALYFVACLMQSGLVAMLPVWLVVPPSIGGEGYSVKDVTIVLSASGLAALHAHIFLRPRIGRVAQASPLRALRTGAGSLVAACFVLPMLRELIWLPSQSLVAIPLPAVLIVWAVWSANLARQAAGTLLGVTARATMHSPGPLLNSLSALGDVLGPLFSALTLGQALSLHLRYPLDVAFLFSATAGCALLVYTGSLLLHLQFRGDFGVMPDEACDPKSSGARNVRGLGGMTGPGGGSDASTDSVSGVAYLVSLALGDLALLLGPVGRGSGFGTRLFNLKSTDLKDV